MKTILENEHGKYGWCIKVSTENIFSDYYTAYFMAHGSDTVFVCRYETINNSKYIKRAI